MDSGLKIPVRVVHHALPDMWLKDYPNLPDKNPQTYVFGGVGYWNSRKNPVCLLEAYIRAFPKPSANTALLLKTFNAGDVESKVTSLAGNARDDIWIYDDQWSESQILWAFQMIDCYVAPTRGEAFGLAQAQAAALGKPVVYTGFSAPTEWLGEGHYPLDHTLVKVSESMSSDDHLFDHVKGPNIQWADVDVNHLSSKLLEISESRPRTGFSPDGVSNFRDMLSWDTVGKSLVDAVEDILDRPLERIQ
jgi:glycosyltransferase involved in cell wall biosynthesis